MALSLRLPARVQQALESPRVLAWFRPGYPPVALEVSSRRLVAVAVQAGGGRAALVESRVVELEAGLVQPSLLRPAVSDEAAFRERLAAALRGLPGFEGKFSLVLPDRVAKIAFVDLDAVPGSARETTELIRWKLKRSTPFRVEDARIAYQPFKREKGGLRCLVVLVQDAVVAQLEGIVRSLGFEAGVVSLSSIDLWNLVQDQLLGVEDALVLNIAEEHAAAIVSRRRVPIFVRSRPPSRGDLITWEEVRTELHPTILYYQDRIGGAGLEKAVVRAPAGLADELLALLSSQYRIPAEPVRFDGLDGTASVEAERLVLAGPAIGAALGR